MRVNYVSYCFVIFSSSFLLNNLVIVRMFLEGLRKETYYTS